MKSALWISAVLVVVAVAALATPTSANKGLVNSDVKRNVFLWSSVARQELAITVLNEGSAPESVYDLAIQEEQLNKLAFLTVSDNDARTLNWKTVDVARNIQANGVSIARVIIHRITLAKPLGPGESTTLRIVMAFGHALQPHPESISQAETQLVRYNDTHYLFSPYHTSKCLTVVKLASPSIQTTSQLQPMKIDGDTITYGPYTSIPAYTLSNLFVHFESSKPFITATKINREFEVSHWGNVAVEDMAIWENTGAKLKGGFSRYTYQMSNMATTTALKDMTITLPDGAADVYYKDAIGNISTSNWHKRRLVVEPRYPLFGGWQTAFCTGYNLPIEKYLAVSKSKSDRFTLTVPVGPAYEMDVFVEKHVVKIILPEGASDIKVLAPFAMEETRESRTTYLDTSGRPVVVLRASNLVHDQLSKSIQVTYSFTSTDLMREPAMLVAGTFAFFFVVILASHLSLDIMPEDAKAQEDKLKHVVAETRRYLELLDSRLKAAKELDTEAASATSNFQKHRQLAKDKIDASTSAVIRIIKDLEPLDSNSAETIREIETILRAKFEAQAAMHTAIQAKKPYDAHKAAYFDADNDINGLRKALAL